MTLVADYMPAYMATAGPEAVLLYATHPYVPGYTFDLKPRLAATKAGVAPTSIRDAATAAMAAGHLIEVVPARGPHPARCMWAENPNPMLMAKPAHVLKLVALAGRAWRTDLAVFIHKVAAGRGRAREVRCTDLQVSESIGRNRCTVWRSHRNLQNRGVLQRTAVGHRRTTRHAATPSRWRVAWFGRLERVAFRDRKQHRRRGQRHRSGHEMQHLRSFTGTNGAHRPAAGVSVRFEELVFPSFFTEMDIESVRRGFANDPEAYRGYWPR